MHSDGFSCLPAIIGENSGQAMPDAGSEVLFRGSSVELLLKGFLQIKEFQEVGARPFLGDGAGTEPMLFIHCVAFQKKGHPRHTVCWVRYQGKTMAMKLYLVKV